MTKRRFHLPRSGSIPQARIKREGSWFLVSDPITQEQGWVLDEYLSSSGATSSQAALASTTEPPSTKAASPKSKKLSQSSKQSKPAVRVSNPRSAKPAFRSREWDPWNIPWARRIDRRRGDRAISDRTTDEAATGLTPFAHSPTLLLCGKVKKPPWPSR